VKHQEEKKCDDGYVPANNPAPKVYDLNGKYRLVLTGSIKRSFEVNLRGRVQQGSKVVFDRNGVEAVTASISDVSDGRIFAEVEEVGSKGIQQGDRIIFDVEDK